MLYDFFNDFFGDDFNFFMGTPVTQHVVENVVCPTCHTDLREFAETGKFGCSDCYKTFKPYLDNVLSSIHGTSQYKGKIPAHKNETLARKRELEDMKKELKEAISAQNFERAAELRDKIKDIEERQ